MEFEYSNMLALIEHPSWITENQGLLLDARLSHFMRHLNQNKKTRPALMQMRRLVMRFMGCTPLELFDGRLLEVELDETENFAQDYLPISTCNPFWNHTFCAELRILVVHPFFHTSPSLLAVVFSVPSSYALGIDEDGPSPAGTRYPTDSWMKWQISFSKIITW
ncbi:hypothetical protein QBC38DRAFT_141804 [Podospora fimiseda]|uniref:Uncharacterized protein n=1 Tax=Podospora fimiseda TaxID=252190 RepID=A0AAN7BEP6_9PEZI|nr:hypothetical protein QBC38DRAFT_141804 [Podospora fimiseda]